MQRVQDKANVSRGTLTHHFDSIHALLAAAIQHIASGQLAEITDLVEAGNEPSSAHDVVDLVRPFMSGTLFMAGLELWSAARTDPGLKAAVLPAEQRLGAELRRLLSPAIDRLDLEMLFSLFRGLAVTSILRDEAVTESAVLDRWADLVDGPGNGRPPVPVTDTSNSDVRQTMRKEPQVDWTAPGPEEVAPGIHRIPLPLPMDGLKAVNVYAVLGSDRHTLIDGGWEIDAAQQALSTALGELGLAARDFEQCLVTHHHRDHYTMALGLRRRAGLVVGLGEGEAEQLDAIRSSVGAFSGAHSLLLAADATTVIDQLAQIPTGPIDPLDFADPDRWLLDDDAVPAAGRSLRVRATPGHTSGHVVFFDDENDLVFSGDHVLPHITPSIGFQAKPARTPLADYLESLATMLTETDRLLLPAHGPAGGRLHQRVEELLAHHERRLTQTASAVRGGASTGFAVAQALRWTRHERHLAELDPMNQMLATTETLAHLQVLVAQERIREIAVDGVWRYT